MKSNLRNEIKSYIVRQGMTMQEVVDLLHDEHGWSDSDGYKFIGKKIT